MTCSFFFEYDVATLNIIRISTDDAGRQSQEGVSVIQYSIECRG